MYAGQFRREFVGIQDSGLRLILADKIHMLASERGKGKKKSAKGVAYTGRTFGEIEVGDALHRLSDKHWAVSRWVPQKGRLFVSIGHIDAYQKNR
jgi:hypothetical protein